MDRNMILAIALSMAVLIGWQVFVITPQQEALKAAREAQAAEEAANPQQSDTAGLDEVLADTTVTLDKALDAAPGRVKIETPNLVGSVNLLGGRIDDLLLRQYKEELDGDDSLIRLLSPREAEHGHYVEQGWTTVRDREGKKLWTLSEGTTLTPTTPITLSRSVNGLEFEKTISVDEKFMFTVTQTVRNASGEATEVTPYALVIQRDIPEGAGKWMILHEGPVGEVGGHYEKKYKKARTAEFKGDADSGWVAITNKYWLAAAIPPQGSNFEAEFKNVNQGADKEENPIFRASYRLPTELLEPGTSASVKSYVFGGPKDVDLLKSYQKPEAEGGLGIKDFDRAVDWGNFWFLTRPIFAVLNYFGDLTGNFGVAILILTLIVKLLLFWFANKGYESMARMKKLQPELEILKERAGDDKMKLQQDMMALYKKEKVNPMAGCLPILIQMPVFYALYKTLFVTIELRHEPFIFWIKDLSAPDPTSVFNLFGLLPYDPTALPLIGAFLGIGVLPLMMGAAMWFQTKLNPPPTDPVQAQVFALMPIMFTFLFAGFASGLVLYWFWNTFLGILQQWYIMKRNGVDVDWGDRLPFLKGGKPAAEAEK